ncbi:MAG: SH3 domain-containing protein [Dysosmobacter sp.]|nr:SH3 domain-containing protein [Dysosmobacter sp.]
MATKKKTAAPVEEQTKVVETEPESTDGVQAGIALEDTAVAGLSDEIVVVDADGGLNLREGPGRGYPVAELLEDGTLLAVLELPHGAEVPGWALVHTGQRTGWVDRHFIQALEPAEEA